MNLQSVARASVIKIKIRKILGDSLSFSREESVHKFSFEWAQRFKELFMDRGDN
jgi:hypothetical protein